MMMPYAESRDYDVFMSFRGEDTRVGFTSHLYDALTRNDIRTYKDDKSLEIGSLIAPGLLEAIEASRFAVVILSSSFATSKWCLEEIAKIVDCLERGKLIVIPVFYRVDPSDVRRQRNCFEQGFTNHEANPEIAPQKVETWRTAFEKLGSLSGLHVTEHRNETEVIREIVSKILKDTQDTLPIDLPNRLVGIESRVDEVKGILRMDSYEVLFIGICGMSGIGKTTLAETVYKDVKDKFQKCSFLENIKDISKQNDSSDLRNLQQKLLNEILHERSIPVHTVNHGQTLLGSKLRGFKVIIVLDDVNHLDQLIYLAGAREWFGPGSRIIITTTDADLLNQHNINEIHMCEEMKGDEALKLFCRSAFEQNHPRLGYETLSDDIVKLAGGLPLALNVYGSLLCGKGENYWIETLKKLGKYPQKEVLGRLEILYTRLDRDQRNTFIYIACFLKGRNKDLVKDILTNIGLYAECGITDLMNKFLITVNLEDSVWMHDLLQQMCWEILYKESVKYVRGHIAIKYRQDIENIVSSNGQETQSVEIINQEPYKVEVDDWFGDPTCFSKMTKLKFVRISNIHFRESLNFLSNDLRILEWYGCSLKSFPSTFQPKHIYELEMCFSQLNTLWKQAQDLPNLRSINLSFSKDLTEIPDLKLASNLEKLNLEGCINLTELHESILLQKRLRYMNLKGCTRLKSLVRSTMEMEALEALLLSGCSNLENIPDFGKNMKRLEHMYVDGTSIKKFPDNLGEMCNLRKLDAGGTSIEELPSFIHRLGKLRLLCVNRCQHSFKTRGFLYTNLDTLSSGLRDLDLSYCNLSEVPDSIGLLSCLVNLDLSGNDFVSLPASIRLLSNLRILCLNDCKKMQSLPKLSVVNEDTLFGLQIRFNYYISRKGVDLSKFHATSNSSSPAISCLNCPKLAEDETGSCLAEKILNSYLQLRTNYWLTPEAVFKILGAGSKIPYGFKMVKFDENLFFEDSWVGVAICAVIYARRTEAYTEAEYVITTYIYVGEKRWTIPVPIKYLVAGIESQLLFYCTVADDFQRMVGSNQKHNCRFSFEVEPGDGNLEVTKFGVRFIRNEDILQLKYHHHSTSLSLLNTFRSTLWLHADTGLHDDLTSTTELFILSYEKQRHSLDALFRTIECVLKVNQEILRECRDEMIHAQLFHLNYDYYRISHGASELFNDFVRLLKDVSSSWLSVKLALEKMVVKSRGDDYTLNEMLQQFNDLEAVRSVRFSDRFVTSFAHICKQAIYFSTRLIGLIQIERKSKSLKVLARVSSTNTACVHSLLAAYITDERRLQQMKDITSHDMMFIRSRLNEKEIFDRELRIWDFYDSAILLDELKKNMTWSAVTKENEAKMVIVIDKLEKKIDSFSKTIKAMTCLAYKYSHDTREAGITLNQFIADGKLPVAKIGVCAKRDEEMLHLKSFNNPMREAVTSLFRASAILPAAPHSYICVSKADNFTSQTVKSILEHTEKVPFSGILEILSCLGGRLFKMKNWYVPIGNSNKEPWERQLQLIYCNNIELIKLNSKLFNDFLNLLTTDIYESWESVMKVLDQILLKSRSGEYTYGEMLLQLNDLNAVEIIGFSDDFVTLFKLICDETASILRNMNFVIDCNKEFETPSLLRRLNLRTYSKMRLKVTKTLKNFGRESSLTMSGVFGIVGICMGDFEFLQEMENMTSDSTLIDLMECFLRKSGTWFDEKGCIRKTSYGKDLRIWDCYGNAILLQELKNKLAGFSSFTKEAEAEMMIIIHKLERKLNDFSSAVSHITEPRHYPVADRVHHTFLNRVITYLLHLLKRITIPFYMIAFWLGFGEQMNGLNG